MARTRRLTRLTLIGALVGGAGLLAFPLGASASLAATQINAQEIVSNFQSSTTDYFSQLQVQSTPATSVSSLDIASAGTHCANCTAESVSFQVVFIQNSNATYTNEALASTSSTFCLQCGAAALASQFVISGPPGIYLTQDGVNDLNDIRQEMAAYGANGGGDITDLLSCANYWQHEIEGVLLEDLTSNAPAIQINEGPMSWKAFGTLNH